MNKEQVIESYKYVAEFYYSGCGKREYMTKEFIAKNGNELNQLINDYVKSQNSGEPPSDRIYRNGIISRTPIYNQNS